MLSLGSIKKLVVEGIKQNTLQFDINSFLQNVVVPDLNRSGKYVENIWRRIG